MAQLSPEGKDGHQKTGRVAASIATEAEAQVWQKFRGLKKAFLMA